MSTFLRCLAIVAAVVLAALLLTPISHAAASPQYGSPESMLLDAANHSRAAAGLPPLQWDAALAAAARQHAQRMAQQNTLSHQFPGELPLQQRAMQTGARFSLIAENVAEGPTVLGLHTQWMNSPPHRANFLDRELNSVGIAVVQSGGQILHAWCCGVILLLQKLKSVAQIGEQRLLKLRQFGRIAGLRNVVTAQHHLAQIRDGLAQRTQLFRQRQIIGADILRGQPKIARGVKQRAAQILNVHWRQVRRVEFQRGH